MLDGAARDSGAVVAAGSCFFALTAFLIRARACQCRLIDSLNSKDIVLLTFEGFISSGRIT